MKRQFLFGTIHTNTSVGRTTVGGQIGAYLITGRILVPGSTATIYRVSRGCLGWARGFAAKLATTSSSRM